MKKRLDSREQEMIVRENDPPAMLPGEIISIEATSALGGFSQRFQVISEYLQT